MIRITHAALAGVALLALAALAVAEDRRPSIDSESPVTTHGHTWSWKTGGPIPGSSPSPMDTIAQGGDEGGLAADSAVVDTDLGPPNTVKTKAEETAAAAPPMRGRRLKFRVKGSRALRGSDCAEICCDQCGCCGPSGNCDTNQCYVACYNDCECTPCAPWPPAALP